MADTQRQRLARLYELTVAMGAARSLGEALERVVTAARELAGARYAALRVSDAHGSITQCCTADWGEQERVATRDPPHDWAVLDALMPQARPVRLRDLDHDPPSMGFPSGLPPIHSCLGMPILSHDRMVGILYLVDKEGAAAFTPDDQRLIEMLVAHAAVTIESARLYERVVQERFELQSLYELSQQVGHTLNYDELVRLILEHLHRAIPHDVSASILMTGNLCDLFIRPICPLSPAVQEEIQRRLFTSFVRMSGKAIRPEQKRCHLRLPETEAFDAIHAPMIRLGSAFQVPLIAEPGNEVVGLLFVGTEREGAFSETQVRLLYTMANQASLSIQRLRASLAEEQQRLESLVEHLPEGVLMVDAKAHIVLANPVAKEHLVALTDAGVGDVLTHLGGHSIEVLLQPPPPGSPYHEIKMDGPPRRVFEVETRPMHIRSESRGWLLVSHDVTASRRVQEHVQQQERLAAVGQLAAGIAHDFNNLLTGIIGYADVLRQRPDMPEPARTRLTRIVDQGERGAHLVRQVLDFSRKSINQPQHLDLAFFLKEATRFLERTIPESIRIVLDIAPDTSLISADPIQIQQVLTNLAVNARDAMPAGGELCVRLSRLVLQPGERPPCPEIQTGEWVLVSVSDTGTGIPEEILPHVFEPFFTTKEPGKGTGLGLAQVYGIVKQHEGCVDIESRIGQGTTFLIYLPALPLWEKLPWEERAQDLPRGHGEPVLLVEDEPEVLEVNQSILEYLGYQVLTATDGQQALETYAAHDDTIALVLTDMVMPKMGGVELFQALRARKPTVKVVMLTGYPLGGEDNQLLAQGIIDWLQKPLRLLQLAQTVHRALASD